MPFPGWAGESECVEIWKKLVPVLRETSVLADGLLIDMGRRMTWTKRCFRERHLISTELAEKSKGSGLLVNSTETLAVMINEEDHLRIQAMRPGMDVRTLWKKWTPWIRRSKRRCAMRFSSRLGYLDGLPDNIGTGLRASIMLHLPGLRLIKEIDAVTRGLNKVALAVRGLLGEGTEAMGNMYQVSNQTNAGRDGRNGHHALDANRDRGDRTRAERARPADGAEGSARARPGWPRGRRSVAGPRLPSAEALDLLSALRLGVELGMVGKHRDGHHQRV